ncbi:hypothetical protein EPI10_012136 [Gossypium australe]|uniref:Uncharacterized protein n=1 Tax=Gossypium australe TaxID=47621 RepID=A0A5B6WAE2_9ROSI|nr:hypothetical protein EPI10_012136 [Gossypium australe]
MKMESGESSLTKRSRGRPSPPARQQQQAKDRPPLTLATLKAVKEKAEKRVNRMSLGISNHHCFLHPTYMYANIKMMTMIMVQYYYDPVGHSYRTKRQVLFAWEELNIICLDT